MSAVTRLNQMCPAANNAKLGNELQFAASLGRVGTAGTKYYVDSVNGSDARDGKSWDQAFATIQAAVDVVDSYGWIFITGRFDESVVTPVWNSGAGPENVKIVGMDGGPGLYVNAPEWRSGGSSEDCLVVRGVGWSVERIKFRVPATASAIKNLHRYTDADVYDASSPNFAPNMVVSNCWFYGGGSCLHGIELHGVAYYIEIVGNYFTLIHNAGATARAIKDAGVGWAAAREIHIGGNHFAECDGYIDFSGGGINAGWIHGNTLQVQNSYNSDPKIDLGGKYGENLVSGNYLGGEYTIVDGYVDGAAGDDWAGNFSMHVGASGVGDNGITIAVAST